MDYLFFLYCHKGDSFIALLLRRTELSLSNSVLFSPEICGILTSHLQQPYIQDWDWFNMPMYQLKNLTKDISGKKCCFFLKKSKITLGSRLSGTYQMTRKYWIKPLNKSHTHTGSSWLPTPFTNHFSLIFQLISASIDKDTIKRTSGS